MLWADSIQQSFFQACEWLEICGQNGIILNPDKFVFCKDTVDFAGFTITNDSVKPNAKYLSSIKDFPTPSNTTDVRSWFGVVNQVAYAFSAAEVMKPFRALLKSGNTFHWNDELERIFQKSKAEIINQIEDGVRIYDKTKITCLATDWSRTGIGYWLLQKHCTCSAIKPFCCRLGWKVTIVGSRFTHTAESRYSPIEGEALAVAYALDHARHFVLGCDNLIVAVDHKPLLHVFENRSLDIPNNRLRNLKEKTLRYKFKVVHIPGTKHKATDAVSRKPSGTIDPPCMELPDDVASVNKGISTILCDFLGSQHSVKVNTTDYVEAINSLNDTQVITWEKIRVATSSDDLMECLLGFVESGFPSCRSDVPMGIAEFYQYREQLSALDGVILYKHRIVVPKSLRKDILSLLHCAHAGVTRMITRAESAIFWPGITKDIHRTRAACSSCNKMAPSQPNAPPINPYSHYVRSS